MLALNKRDGSHVVSGKYLPSVELRGRMKRGRKGQKEEKGKFINLEIYIELNMFDHMMQKQN